MVRKCGQCDHTLPRQEPYVDCGACRKSYHKKCSKLSDSEFTLMSSNKSTLKWFCRLCDDHVIDVLSNIERFKKMNSELTKIKSEIDGKLAEFEARLSKCENLEKNSEVKMVIRKVVNESLPELKSSDEKEWIEKKKNNLIYFKIPESASEDPAERLKNDFGKLQEMYGSDKVNPIHINQIFRVGKKGNHARPLVVRFKDSNVKRTYCEMSFGKDVRRLTVKQNSEIINISVTHDKTKKQREAYKLCLSELNDRANNGETDLVIRNNKIVPNFRECEERIRPTWASVVRDLI